MDDLDIQQIERLNRYLDSLTSGETPPDGSDAGFAGTMRRLSRIDTAPGPDPAFAERLREEIMASATPEKVRRIPRRWIRRVDLLAVAALLVAMLTITV